jgi:NAD(P)H dehydrogenase (quinone)
MRISVILAHPSRTSLNHAIAHAVVKTLRKNGHAVLFHDLYAEKFNPVLPAAEIPKGGRLPGAVRKHCGQIAKAEGLVLVHPNWWGEPPAILKGWVDRVLRVGVAYDFPDGPEGKAGLPIELLTIRAVLILNTSDTPREREETVLGDPLGRLWKNTLTFCGVRNIRRFMYRVVATSSPGERAAWIADAAERARRVFASSS